SIANSNISICRRCAPSFVQQRKTITNFRHLFAVSSTRRRSANRAYSPDSGESMFITKKHISRRTLLKGGGVGLALPLLDAMIPAGTALAQTAAAPKIRTGFFYIPHGAIMHNTAHGPAMDEWTPSGAGAEFTLSP